MLMGPGPLTGGYARPPPSTKKKAAVVYGLVQGGRKKQDGKVPGGAAKLSAENTTDEPVDNTEWRQDLAKPPAPTLP